MPITLQSPIADYFAADRKGDSVAVARCFAENAVVIDERQTHTGRDAIRRWKTDASAKYDYVSEPIAVSGEGDRFVVTARLAGNFQGSPVDVRYAFNIEGNAIARMEIAP